LVSDKTHNFVNELYKTKTIKQFRDDLDLFLKHYKPITLQEVINYNKGELELTEPSFHLTFDDGLSNFYYEVAPILLEKNIPATIFLNTDFVDNKNLFYRYKANLILENLKFNSEILREDVNFKPLKVNFNNKHLLDEYANDINLDFDQFLEKEKPYLSLEQIKELQKQGFTFGSHSCNHPLYTDISIDKQSKQTLDSLQWIKNNLNEDNLVFSFPFHDIGISKQFFNNIKNNVELTFGTSGFNKDIISSNLHRLDMEKAVGNIKYFLIKKYIKLLFKKVLNKHIIDRK